MIYELLENFSKDLEKNPELVIKAYTLNEGIYVRISENTLEFFNVKKDKEENKDKNKKSTYLYNLYTQNGDLAMNEDEDWFKQRMYYSKAKEGKRITLVGNDKALYSTNFLTLFFDIATKKKEDNASYIRKNLDIYFNKVEFLDECKIAPELEKHVKDENRLKDLSMSKQIIKDNFDSILNWAKDNNMVKIHVFLDKDIELYKIESQIYLLNNTFLSKKDCERINGKEYGMSNFNNTLNIKKKYLKHLTRSESGIPFLISTDVSNKLSDFQIYFEKHLFDICKEYKHECKKILGPLFINSDVQNKKKCITNYDYIPIEHDKYKFEEFKLINFMGIKDKNSKNIAIYPIIKDLNELKNKVDEFLYQNKLIKNIFKDDTKFNNDTKKESKYFKNLFYSTKNAMIDYFYKYDERGFDYIINKYDIDFIKSALVYDIDFIKSVSPEDEKNDWLNAKKAINMIFSIKYNKEGEKMDLNVVYSNVEKALNSDEILKLEANEYYFLAGQIAMFLIQKSKAAKKTFALAEPYLRAKTVTRLQKVLIEDFKIYKHEIFISYIKFKKAFFLVQNREDENITTEFESLFLAGMMKETLIKKIETEDTKGDNDE